MRFISKEVQENLDFENAFVIASSYISYSHSTTLNAFFKIVINVIIIALHLSFKMSNTKVSP